MTVVMVVSRRLGHVTLATSWRTSCKNLKGLTFAIVPCPIVPRALPSSLPRRHPAAPKLLRGEDETAHSAPAPILDGLDRARALLWDTIAAEERGHSPHATPSPNAGRR